MPPVPHLHVFRYKVGAPARVGLVAPVDVKIPAGPTGMDPSQTSFYQVSSRKAAGGISALLQEHGMPADNLAVCTVTLQRTSRPMTLQHASCAGPGHCHQDQQGYH